MTSTFSSTKWLPAALVRAAIVPRANVRPAGPRHLAAEEPDTPPVATPPHVTCAGRHAESEWSRALHDPERDEIDAFTWLGFAEPASV